MKSLLIVPFVFILVSHFSAHCFANTSSEKYNPAEKYVLAQVEKGKLAELKAFPEDARILTANFLKDLLTGSLPATEKGIRIEDARIKEEIDFTDVKIPFSVVLSNCIFYESIDFRGTTFSAGAYFIESKFSRPAYFTESKFSGYGYFSESKFSGEARFHNAEFSEKADFFETKFSGETGFREAKFSGEADFSEAKFSGEADFSEAKFSEEVDFSKAKFSDKTDFFGTKFSKKAFFFDTIFSKEAVFFETEFSGRTAFDDAEFSEKADFFGTKFSGETGFREAKFSGEADFSEAKFSGEADFSEAKFSKNANFADAKFSKRAEFHNAKFSGEDSCFNAEFFGEADFSWAKFSDKTNFSKAKFSDKADFSWSKFFGKADFHIAEFSRGPDFVSAYLGKADLRNADLSKADLRNADLSEADLSEANLEGCILNVVTRLPIVYEPKAGSPPYIPSIAALHYLSALTFKESPHGLIDLREGFKKLGYREQEREITYAIKHTQRLNLWKSKESIGDRFESLFYYLFFELTCQYGLKPGQPLILIIILIFIFTIPYTLVLKSPPEEDGIWKVWISDRVRKELGGEKPIRLNLKFFRALAFGFYFSLLSAFSIGWRELNVRNWITRIQPTEYTLRATGWIRTVSGIQSLISVYLVALWVLTYFGRPFESF